MVRVDRRVFGEGRQDLLLRRGKLGVSQHTVLVQLRQLGQFVRRCVRRRLDDVDDQGGEGVGLIARREVHLDAILAAAAAAASTGSCGH